MRKRQRRQKDGGDAGRRPSTAPRVSLSNDAAQSLLTGPVSTAAEARLVQRAFDAGVAGRVLRQKQAPAREPTDIEREFWSNMFDQPLANRLITNYMDGTGAPVHLGEQEMRWVEPVVAIDKYVEDSGERVNPQFDALAADIFGEGEGGQRQVSLSSIARAKADATLGHFTVHWDGILSVHPSREWTFHGTMRFYDKWDFDKSGHRGIWAEVATGIGRWGLPGTAFEVTSDRVPVWQTSSEDYVQWGAPPPRTLRTTGSEMFVEAVGAYETAKSAF